MAYKGKLKFLWQSDESIHGLGQGEEGIYNYRGNVQYLYQHNMRIPIPFFISNKGYGILVDCGCLMTFNDDARGSYLYMDMVDQLDYYFIAGESVDERIAGYRRLTGKAVMLPKWAYGYVQSKEAYHTQEELLEVAKEYRKRKIPLDCIVQDWNTWESGAWGNKKVDKKRYPNIKEMNQMLHEMNVHSMVSIWPVMTAGTDNHEEMKEKGFLFNDNTTYNAFIEEARSLYWKQVREELFSGGFDAWWCDSAEPFSGPDWNGEHRREPWERFSIVGEEHKKFLGADCANIYPVAHAKGIYENQRKEDGNKRVLNLTRAGYASSQKYATMFWSGDTSATWNTLCKQITEGLNMCMSGMPYWTLDIGGFFTVNENWKNRGCSSNEDPTPKWFWRGDYEEGVNDLGYRELYVRWLQYGAFLPMFRSHGTDTPREIWNFGEPG
ncbi:glycoside hydrolase, partial [Lachnotalea glycerini]